MSVGDKLYLSKGLLIAEGGAGRKSEIERPDPKTRAGRWRGGNFLPIVHVARYVDVGDLPGFSTYENKRPFAPLVVCIVQGLARKNSHKVHHVEYFCVIFHTLFITMRSQQHKCFLEKHFFSEDGINNVAQLKPMTPS